VHVRLYVVKRYGVAIDQYKPYHQLRATQAAAESRARFDDRSWYPSGFPTGPQEAAVSSQGLITTTLLIYRTSQAVLGDYLTLHDICVFVPPLFSVFAVFAAYALAKEGAVDRRSADASKARAAMSTADHSDLRTQVSAEVVPVAAAFFVAVAPGLISKSMAGLYDSECVGVAVVLVASFLWLRSVNRGSTVWAAVAALAFGYLSSVWQEGMVFFAFIVSLHVFAMCLSGRYSARLYVSCTAIIPLGAALAFPFLNVSLGTKAAGIACLGAFIIVLVARRAASCHSDVKVAASVAVTVAAVGIAILSWHEYTARSSSVLSSFVAGSTSEHRPTTWGQFFLDLHVLALLFPSGLYYCIHAPSDGRVFFAVFGLAGMVATACMVSKMTLLAPAACLLGALALGEHISTQAVLIAKAMTAMNSLGSSDGRGSSSSSIASFSSIAPTTSSATTTVTNRMKKAAARVERRRSQEHQERQALGLSAVMSGFLLLGSAFFLVLFWWHCDWVASELYAVPSIVVPARRNDGLQIAFDDFREAYAWLRTNTPEDAKVMAWWDYGYQLNSLANRTTLVDNAAPVLASREMPFASEARSMQVANVARIMVSSEARAHALLHSLGVEYVMVVFGGVTGYGADDMSNFPLMAKIAAEGFPGEIRAGNYYTKTKKKAAGAVPRAKTAFDVGKLAPSALTQSLLYRLSYSNFGLMQTDVDKARGYDRVRRSAVGTLVTELTHFEEMLTTEHWLARVYKVQPPSGV
jgi:dolichyl-diphosphooligosaccharide--protein glycosyltransferase